MKITRTATEAAVATALTAACVASVMRGVLPPVATAPYAAPVPAPPPGGGPDYAPVEPASNPRVPCDERLGPSFDSDASMRRNASAVASYTLRAKLDADTHVVHAEGVITWTNRSRASVRTLYVHAYLNAFKNEQSTFLSERDAGGRGSGALRAPGELDVNRFAVREMGGEDLWPSARNADDANPNDQTDLAIALPGDVAVGQTIHVDVAFDARLPWVVERSGYAGSFNMVAQWFPKIARLRPDGTFAHFPYRHLSEFYADFGDYDVTIDVPDGYEVGATGRQVADEHAGGRRVVHYVQRDIHDFAFAAYDGFRVLTRQSDGIAMRCLVPAGCEAVGEQELDAAAFGLRAYGHSYGAYPYETLTIVHPPPDAEEAGGMEYPTLITTGGPWYAFSQAGWVRSLTLHELGHQYFYGLVATNEERWPFLDEGMTSYAAYEALDQGWGQASLWAIGWSTGGTDGLLRYLGLPAGHDDIIAQPADSFVSWRSYGLLVYARTALVMRTLDRAYEPGAAKRALGRYARRYRFDHPGPSQLLGAVRDTVGDDAARELGTALFDRGWVDYAMTDARCDDARKCSIVVTRRGNLTFPVDIDVTASNGTVHRIHWDGRGRQVALPVADVQDISSVVIDPERRILLDEDLANNTLRVRGAPRAWRVWDRAAYALALAAYAVAP